MEDTEGQGRTGPALRLVEDGFYVAVAAALVVAGIALFVHSIYRFTVRRWV